MADMTKAVELSPHDDWVFKQRGNLHSLQGDLQAALTDINTAIQIQSKSARYLPTGLSAESGRRCQLLSKTLAKPSI